MNSSDIQALLSNEATIETRIEILPLSPDGDVVVLTQDNAIIDWQHEDFRYVNKEGWIGQFVARQLTCNIKNISDDFYIGDREIILYLGIKVGENTTWYSLGNFLVDKIEEDEVKDVTSFKGLDYTKKFNKVYEDGLEYPCTALALAQNVCEQCGCELGSISFKNSDYIIEGNVFTNNETCREVMKQIGKLAFSWVRVDWDNKIYIDFEPNTNIVEENIIDNSKYYDLTTKKDIYGPVDKIVVGYSMVDGEQNHIGDDEGKVALSVFDNPLVYTDNQRVAILQNAHDLLGLTYRPCEFTTIGHPWLKGNERIRLIDMENVSHETYAFDRTIEYFGHIKTKIKTSAQSNTNAKYSYNSDIVKNLKNVQFVVNKMDGKITSTAEDIEILNDAVENINSTILTQTAEQFEMLFTQTGIKEAVDQLEGALEGNTDSLNTITEYIRFEGAEITLGKSTSQTKLIIKNDRISFMTGDTESAYISENTLYITDSTILNKMQVGRWETKEDEYGNLNTKWVGGE